MGRRAPAVSHRVSFNNLRFVGGIAYGEGYPLYPSFRFIQAVKLTATEARGLPVRLPVNYRGRIDGR